MLVQVDDVHAGGARKRRQDTANVRCIGRKNVTAGDDREVVVRRTFWWCGEAVLVVVSALAVADLVRPLFSSADHVDQNKAIWMTTTDIHRRPPLRFKILQLGKDYYSMLRALLNLVPCAIQNAPSLTGSFCAFLHISLLTFIALFNACMRQQPTHVSSAPA